MTLTSQEYNKVKNIISNFKLRYPDLGFTDGEIASLIEQYFPTVNIQDFNKKLGVHTCLLIDNEVITYHHDVELGIICVLENREQTSQEWD